MKLSFAFNSKSSRPLQGFSLAGVLVFLFIGAAGAAPQQLSGLHENQGISGFRLVNLYSDAKGEIVGAKFLHSRTAVPVFLLQIETVPKALMWVDTPDQSDRGVPHALEHVLAYKGAKGRYLTLLTNMRLSQSIAATVQDFNFYAFSSGTGTDGFFEELHAWLDALFHSDFTDTEAERELYHFGVAIDSTKHRTLAEQGTVYDEKQTGQRAEIYYFELNKRTLGSLNPFASDIRGVPDAMRAVTAADIRQFYNAHYRLGPTTGFVFMLNPKEDVVSFLDKVSREFDTFAQPGSAGINTTPTTQPKYPINSSEDTSIGIYSFPSGRETDSAAIRVGWKPVKIESPTELKLLQLFFRGLASDQNSVLYRTFVDAKTREIDSGARKLDYDVFLYNSPFFPFEQIEVSGIPGDRISIEEVDKVRNLIVRKITQIAQYLDGSPDLETFNKLVSSHAKAWRRSDALWIKTPPSFGGDFNFEWKNYLAMLEMDHSFVRSLSEEQIWQAVERELQSDRNIWRTLISKFRLTDMPYATASKPSPQMLANLENARQDRIRTKIDTLRRQYQVNDDQEALQRFEADESKKTQEIDAIDEGVLRPQFTQYPPLTADDDIRCQQFSIAETPVIASIFERPPTLDVGLAFDLRQIPRKYYKYLPILPRSFDSLGLKNGQQAISYPELLAEIQEKTVAFTVGYEQNAASKREDLVFRLSAANSQELRDALKLLAQILQSSNLELSTVDRLRDLVNQRLAVDDAFKADEFRWVQNASYGFLTQQDILFQAVNTATTRFHWDERLKWQLHKPVSLAQIEALDQFADKFLAGPKSVSDTDILDVMKRPDLDSLQRELLEYWRRNLSSIPDTELTEGLRRLTAEVLEDLKTGPEQALTQLRELHKIVVNRRLLHVDLVVDQPTLEDTKQDLTGLIASLSSTPLPETSKSDKASTSLPVMARVSQRYHLPNLDFPWNVGFVAPDAAAAGMFVYAQQPGYSQLDDRSLITVLSTKIFAGTGPQTFFTKTREAGLAYSNTLTSSPAFRLMWDYADRSPDVPALVTLMNGVAQKISNLKDPRLVDYALRQTFSLPRSMSSPSVRGPAIARDIRDGYDRETVRRFSQAILQLRQRPDLLSDLTRAGVNSICGVLLDQRCNQQHRSDHSIFFFGASEKTLSDIEKRVPIPKLLRVWPSDYWID